MEKFIFELIENNNHSTSYNYFGQFNWNEDGVGLDIKYPEINTKSEWYKVLISESDCMSAAILGVLYNEYKMTKESFCLTYVDIYEIISSNQFVNFIKNWFDADGVIFAEPIFFDGIFGRFSNEGDLGYPDNYEDDISYMYHWNNHAIKIIFSEKKSFDELYVKLYIDVSVESKFKNELHAIIELFNPKDSK